jgi:hypothetical protein
MNVYVYIILSIDSFEGSKWIGQLITSCIHLIRFDFFMFVKNMKIEEEMGEYCDLMTKYNMYVTVDSFLLGKWKSGT